MFLNKLLLMLLLSISHIQKESIVVLVYFLIIDRSRVHDVEALSTLTLLSFAEVL